jgi:carbon storage regulator
LLTLTRKVGESIRIGDEITVVVKEIKGKQVRLGIEAPRDIYVCREELFMKIEEANRSAMMMTPDHSASASALDSLSALSSLLKAPKQSQSPDTQSKAKRGGGEDGQD